ncbi:MAG: hypothetical protein K6F08_02165 [bacterium]|nr:hypothetical protein [bacterium]
MRKTLTILIALLICANAFCFLMPKNVAFAEEATSQVILSRNYDYSNYSSFTPFNFETESRMSGKSAAFEYGEKNNFTGEFDVNESVNIAEDKGVAFWIYFSTKKVHNLTVSLSNSTSSIQFVIPAETLSDILTKQEHYQDEAGDGYSWNYLELPFVAGEKNNVSIDSNMVVEKIAISYNSSSEETEGFAKVYVYEMSVVKVSKNIPYVNELNKQGYRIFKVEFYNEESLNKICVGDRITMKRRTQLIKYAWVGEENVNTLSYPLEIRLTYGDENKLWEQDQVFEFESTGQHLLKFSILNSDNYILLYDILTFNVTEFIGISFNQNIKSYKVGDKVAFALTFNRNLVTISNLHFEIQGDCAKIVSEDTENGIVVVEMLSEGSFKLSATGQADRFFTTGINVSTNKTFEVKNKAAADNSSLIIISIVFVGIIGLGGAIWGIKSIIKANKYKVR